MANDDVSARTSSKVNPMKLYRPIRQREWGGERERERIQRKERRDREDRKKGKSNRERRSRE